LGRRAIFAGTFDPVTNGHLDIAMRAAAMFDELIVAVSETGRGLFSADERAEMFRKALQDQPHVQVKTFGGTLLTEFARKEGASVLIRSMRGNTDFDYEFDMALMNRKMAPEIESIFMMSKLENLYISGTRIREVAALGYDVAELVPPHVNEAIKKKFGRS
jgi:pantetheine-phosphate adenylyltransferase